MSIKKAKLAIAREQAEAALNQTNVKIGELGKKASALHNQLCTIQEHFDKIRNVPSDEMIRYEKLKEIHLSWIWKQQSEIIETDYNAARATGTGVCTGYCFLASAGPVGWAIASVSILCSGFFIWKSVNEKHRLEDIFSLISDRDTKKYNLATIKLNERITQIIKETALIEEAIVKIQTFGFDYTKMSESQQYELGSYVNLMNSSTQLLVNPILGLNPGYTEEDYSTFHEKIKPASLPGITANVYKDLIIMFSNLFYSIKVDEKDQKLLYKSFKKNKKFLQAINVEKKNFSFSIIEDTFVALKLQMKS